MHAVSMSAWYGKSGIGLYHEIEVILLKISKALLLVNKQYKSERIMNGQYHATHIIVIL